MLIRSSSRAGSAHLRSAWAALLDSGAVWGALLDSGAVLGAESCGAEF